MYYDLLSQLKNAVRARKEAVLMPLSNMDYAIAKVLEKAGYVKSVEKKTIGKKQFLEVRLSYTHHESAITDFKIVSKPSRRLYGGYKNLRPVRQGFGIAVLTTPKGVMSNRDARKEKVGGETLFEIW